MHLLKKKTEDEKDGRKRQNPTHVGMPIPRGTGAAKGRRCHARLHGVMHAVVVPTGPERSSVGSFIIAEEGIMAWLLLRLREVSEGCGGADGVLQLTLPLPPGVYVAKGFALTMVRKLREVSDSDCEHANTTFMDMHVSFFLRGFGVRVRQTWGFHRLCRSCRNHDRIPMVIVGFGRVCVCV